MSVYLKVFFLSFLCCVLDIHAQQQTQFSHTEELYSLLQPAFRSKTEQAHVSFVNRSQWVGYRSSTDVDVNGNPVTKALFFSAPMSLTGSEDKMEHIGISLINDNIGITNQKKISLSFSRQIKIKTDGRLSFGLKPSILVQKLNQQQFVTIDSDDPVVNSLTGSNNLSSVTMDVGLWYYTTNYGVGLSINNMLNSNDLLINSRELQADFYSDISLTPNVSIIPRINVLSDFYNLSWLLGTFTKISVLDQQIKGGFLFRQSFSGTPYALNDIGVQLGIPQLKGTQIGFSYSLDFITTQRGAKSATSHEVVLSYYLGRKKRLNSKPLYSPRYKIGE